jgi:hypothetical protein
MLIHLHIGLDKTGSTAIQYHMKENRNWYARKGVFIPETGFLFGGHQVLFKDMFPKDIGPLLKEIDAAQSLGFEQLFFSWEGMRSMPPARLGQLKKLFNDSEFIIYVYLREQSEIIQSAYLQSLKTVHSENSLQNPGFSSLLNDERRDYKKLLDKFSECFGKQSLRIRIYDKELLVEGGVVADLLSAMSLEQDEEFSEVHHTSNPSLDLPALRILDEIPQKDNPGRRAIIDILRNEIAINGAHEKHFLTKQETEQIRNNYLESNRAVVNEYLGPEWPHPDLFPYRKKTYITEDEQSIGEVVKSRRQTIANIQGYYTWAGKEIGGTDLGRIAPQALGWSHASASGVSSLSTCSVLRFRIMWEAIMPFHTGIRLVLKQSRPSSGGVWRISFNGVDAGAIQSDEATFDVPMDTLDKFRLVELKITEEMAASNKTTDPNREGLTIHSMRFDRLGTIQ